MRATRCLLAKGFVGRSMDELKRFTQIAVRLEAIRGPQGPYVLHTFDSSEAVEDCKLMSDDEIGGFSTSNLSWHPAETRTTQSKKQAGAPASGYARFHGSISTELPHDRPDVMRTGYAAWRTEDRKRTAFGRGFWDIDPYLYLAMRIRSDGRGYFVNVQTDSIVPTDLHQHRLFAKRPGEWETVLIKWNDFVRTNHGMPMEPQTELLRQKVKSIGVGLTDRVPGPFELCIERIWATNDVSEANGEETTQEKTHEPPVGGASLKTRSGKSVLWNTDSTRRSN